VRAQPTVLVIAGTDSSGGAGVSRDLRVLADCEVAAVTAVTAVTAQSHTRVHGIHTIPPELIREQIAAALEANNIRAIKIGMLGTAACVEAVAHSLPLHEMIPSVLDPILASSSGTSLLDESGRSAMRELLLPNVTLLTPNIPEAATLLGMAPAMDESTAIDAARRLRDLGPQAVLIKGGHGTGAECVDILVTADDEIVRLSSPRLPVSMRGTGCALASAIAAGLARGLPLDYACRFARTYLTKQLQALADGP
jgi:hydroxymethylpyrimidine/phosphomethylpyrimidine kinase